MAANRLVDAKLYPQSIYFYSQTVEKAGKSVFALYLTNHKNNTESDALKEIKGYSHELKKLGSEVSRIFVDTDKRLISKHGEKVDARLIQMADQSIERIRNQKNDMIALIAFYEHNVKRIYELYCRLREPSVSEHPYLKILREQFKNPVTRYIKFNTLSMYLFSLLDGMENYSRYPMDDVGTNNIKFLSIPEVGTSCKLLKEMVGELVDLVPSVWNRLESVKP